MQVIDTPPYGDVLAGLPQLKFLQPRVNRDFIMDCFGGRTRRSFLHLTQEALSSHSFGDVAELFAPSFSEDFFDWLDLIDATGTATEPFCMVELGAGFGRWLVHGANLCKLLGRPLGLLVACEAEPTHFSWIDTHFRDNNIDPSAHRRMESAVTGQKGRVPFYVGAASSWYGQSIAQNLIDSGAPRRQSIWTKLRVLLGRERPMDRVRDVESVSLEDVLSGLQAVDLIHVDVQGAEFEVFAESMKIVNERIRLAHIATHAPFVEAAKGRDMDALIHQVFSAHGWIERTRVKPAEEITISGRTIKFVDGVQSWRNPRLP